MRVLNFYSSVFADQLRRGRKTATIRLGDKSHKYRKNDCVLVTIGYQHSPREKIFYAVIDQVEVKRVKDLSPRDIEHDNPEFRRVDEMVHFLEQIYGRSVGMDDTVTVVRFSQIIENPPECGTGSTGSAGRATSALRWCRGRQRDRGSFLGTIDRPAIEAPYRSVVTQRATAATPSTGQPWHSP